MVQGEPCPWGLHRFFSCVEILFSYRCLGPGCASQPGLLPWYGLGGLGGLGALTPPPPPTPQPRKKVFFHRHSHRKNIDMGWLININITLLAVARNLNTHKYKETRCTRYKHMLCDKWRFVITDIFGWSFPWPALECVNTNDDEQKYETSNFKSIPSCNNRVTYFNFLHT